VPKVRRETNRAVLNFVGSVSKTVLFDTLSEEDATEIDSQNEISELQTEQLFVLKCRKRTDDSCVCSLQPVSSRLRLGVTAHAQKPDFVFRRNGRVHLNRPVGVSSVDCWHPRCADQR